LNEESKFLKKLSMNKKSSEIFENRRIFFKFLLRMSSDNIFFLKFCPPIFVTQIFAPPIFMTSLRRCIQVYLSWSMNLLLLSE